MTAVDSGIFIAKTVSGRYHFVGIDFAILWFSGTYEHPAGEMGC